MSPTMSRPVVLVTGCSKGGIGFALCEEYATRGCTVYATARRAESLEGFNPQHDIHKLTLDVLDEENVNGVVRTIIDAESKIDIVVNGAGALCAGALLDIPLDQIQRAFDTNTYSVLRISKAVIPHMAERRRGTIVNIGSLVGETPTPWNGAYSAAKAALHTISEVLWMECKALNVDVVLVSTGGVRSNISSNQMSTFSIPENSLFKAYLPQILRRIGASQASGSMPTEEYARRVVDATLTPKPLRYFMIGANSWLFWLFKWLPRTLVLSWMWRNFSS